MGTNNLPPKTLNEKHHLVAYMQLAGATNIEIAAALDYHPTRVSAIQGSPLYKALLDKLRKDLNQRTVGAVIDRIISEGPRNVEVLVELREHAENERVRLEAARDMLDRNPETSKVSRQENRSEQRIIFDTHALHRLIGVLQEDGPIVHTVALPPAPDGAVVPVHSPALGIKTLDETLADLEALEAAAAAE